MFGVLGEGMGWLLDRSGRVILCYSHFDYLFLIVVNT